MMLHILSFMFDGSAIPTTLIIQSNVNSMGLQQKEKPTRTCMSGYHIQIETAILYTILMVMNGTKRLACYLFLILRGEGVQEYVEST